MRVFITGAGLIGAETAKQLIDQGHEVVLYDVDPSEALIHSVLGARSTRIERGDITNLAALVELMLAYQPDIVIHTVSLIGGVAQRRPYTTVAVNVGGTVNAVEAARLAGVRRLVYASTHGVYDFVQTSDGLVTERNATSAAGLYPATKLASEHLLEAYAHTYELDVIAIRFCNLFGRGLYAAGSTGGMAFNELVEKPVRGETARILPSVATRAEWLYGKDAARAMVAATERHSQGGFKVVNVGSGELVTADDVAAAVRQIIPQAQFEALAHGAPRRERQNPFDLTTAKAAIGWQPIYTLQSAVADYIKEVQSALSDS